MKKSNFSRFAQLIAVSFVLTGILSLSGCKPQVDNTKPVDMSTVVDIDTEDPINAEWESGWGEVFDIFAEEDVFWTESYEGNNLKIRKLDETSGYIYMQYVVVYDWDKGQKEEPAEEDIANWLNSWGSWYPLNEALIGKWYAVYYSDLAVPEDGVKTVKLSGAFKAGGKKACDTLEKAANEFTVENGYFADSSNCSESACY